MVKVVVILVAGLFLAGASWAGTVRYMMWDASQVPAYRQCAADFQKRNPTTVIKIRQAGWGDYWTAISTGFISETAPDVFVNHLAKYPEIVSNDLLVDLQPLIKRDGVRADLYNPVLFGAWAQDGKQYGMPKDWDTVAMAVNLDHAKRQGVSLEELRNMDWNPQDGGSFERVVKRLTVDAKGHNALSPLFNKTQVVMYGYQNPGSGGMTGQTAWSHFAVSNGFQFQDAPWSKRLHYDSPKMAETIDYLASLPGKGVSVPFERARSSGASAMFASQKVALVPEGSWMIHYFKDKARFAYAWVPLPRGPKGHRASMFNGTADSIWKGTKVREEAWKWVKYLASPDCQNTVARFGVVFPAVLGTEEQVREMHKLEGVDSSAFLIMSKEHTFLSPITQNASEINEIVDGAIEASLLGKIETARALKAASDQVRRLLAK